MSNTQLELERTPNNPDVGEAALVMALGILVERIAKLPDADRTDLFELAKEIPAAQGSHEEMEAIRTAMLEILEQSPVMVHPMDLSDQADRPEKLRKWMSFVGNKIRSRRRAAGLTQMQLADKADLPQSHISRLEAGKHSPSHKTVEKIAEALGVPAGTLDPSRNE